MARDDVIDCAPVRDDEAIELPLVTEDIFQQITVFASVNPVNFVVRGHNHPGFRLFYRKFKGAEVNLVEGTKIHDRIVDHAIALLRIAGEMF